MRRKVFPSIVIAVHSPEVFHFNHRVPIINQFPLRDPKSIVFNNVSGNFEETAALAFPVDGNFLQLCLLFYHRTLFPSVGQAKRGLAPEQYYLVWRGGLTETIVTVAMISGPPLGSALYTAGGYSCPFVSFGSVIIFMSIASYYLISEDKSDSAESKIDPGNLTLKEYKGLLKLPAGAMVLVSVTCNVTADAFILIALSEHLVQGNCVTNL
ncbi:hypothetical protein HNY73_016846 [Argiope bruennichi]|uniref:Uncharacterized protein n=1 Tax=Argiope bruennichi TaxID=94029 RepID=A0A8T0EL30_ARGBR|nr:hypothetical protein HNY73_016846 [Argiope bruennichi]